MRERLYESFEILNGVAPVQTVADTAVNTPYLKASNSEEICAVLVCGAINASTTTVTMSANTTDGTITTPVKDYNGNALSVVITPNTKVAKIRIVDPANATNDGDVISINGVNYKNKSASPDPQNNEYNTVTDLANLISTDFPDYIVTVATNDVLVESQADDITATSANEIVITTEKATRILSIAPSMIEKNGDEDVRFSVTSANNTAMVSLVVFKNSYRTVSKNVSKNEML